MRVNALSKLGYGRMMRKLMMAFLIILCASISFNGYFSKWAFNDDSSSYNMERVFDGTATRPFVYRQLLPGLAKEVSSFIPARTGSKPENTLIKVQQSIEKAYPKAHVPDRYRLEYFLVMVFDYISFLLAIWQLSKLLYEVWGDKVSAWLASFLFILLFPLLETNGGFYYDSFEILFFTIATRLALHGKWLGLFVLAPIATLNKESFFFFLFSLYPFFATRFSWKKSAFFTLGAVFFSGLLYLYVHLAYAANDGGTVTTHLMEHVEEFFSLKTYFKTEVTYGMSLGSKMFFLHILFVLYIVKAAWKSLSTVWKRHAYIALALTVPLYWLFCSPGEIRNLSMLYMSFCVMLAKFIHDMLHSYYTNQINGVTTNRGNGKEGTCSGLSSRKSA